MYTQFAQRTKAGLSHTPQSFGATTEVLGTVIDRLGFKSIKVLVNHAAPTQTAGTGTPTGTITLTVKEGTTTSPTTLVTMDTAIVGTDIAAAGVDAYEINLEGMGRYIKINALAALTAAGGGNTPLCTAAIDYILGDPSTEPQPSAVPVSKKA